MEQVVELLRTCYVRDGWKVDDESAERALEFARQYAKDGTETDEGREAAIDFVGSHGQSLDWVFCGDVGGMICRGAKHSERANSIALDPIFAAIDAWRRADDAVVAVPYGVNIELGDQCHEAYLAVIRTRPITPAGLAALTSWVREHADWLCANSTVLTGEGLCALTDAIDNATRGMSGLEPWSPPPAAALIGRHIDAPLLVLAEEHAAASKEYDRLEAVWHELDNQRCESGKYPHGYKSADAHRTRQGKICGKLEQRIIAMPARTFEGVTAKARALSTSLVNGQSVEAGIDASYAASMARDLLAIARERA
jgi:hypothetical protein